MVVTFSSIVINYYTLLLLCFKICLSVSAAQCTDCTFTAVYVNYRYKRGSGDLQCITNPSPEDRTLPCNTECAVS